MVDYNAKNLKIHGGSEYIVSQNTCSQYIVSKSISKYMVVYNAKNLKIHYGSQYIVSQNTCSQ